MQGGTLCLFRHDLWLENEIAHDTTETIPQTLITIDATSDWTSKNMELEELKDNSKQDNQDVIKVSAWRHSPVDA